MRTHWFPLVLALGALSCAAPEPPPARPLMMKTLEAPSVDGAMAPHLASTGTSAVMTWIEPAGDEHRVRFSRLEGGAWSAPSTIAQGGDFFVNWADFPSVETTASGFLIAHWLQKSGAGTYAYDVRLARSDDAGATWRPLGTAHDDGTPTEHGFVSLVAEGDGVRAFWLDGREMQATGHATDGHESEGRMSLRTVLIGDTVGRSEVLDEMTCECCQTGAAMTGKGAIVVYRDRTAEEIRDIAIVRRDGEGWTLPAMVHADGWVVPGCPVNGPAVAAGGADGRRVAVAWFTAADNRPRVQVAFSDDAGGRFEAPVAIDAAGPVGRVDVALDDSGDAIVSWLGGVDRDNAAVRMIRVPGPWVGPSPAAGRAIVAGSSTAGGSAATAAPLTVALTGGSRASGFPRIVRSGDEVVVAWTGMSRGTELRTAVVPVSGIPRFSPGEAGGAGKTDGPGETGGADRAAAIPEFAAADLEGGSVALADLRGSPVLLNLWATWCLPCREEIPVLKQVHERYAGRGLRVVGVSLDDAASVEAVRSFVSEYGIPWRNLHDPEGLAWRVFGLPMLPVSLLLDDEGHIVWRRQGPLQPHDADLHRALAALFPEPAG